MINNQENVFLWVLFIFSFFLFFFPLFWERECTHTVGERQRARERILSRLCAERPAWHRAQSQDPESMTYTEIKSWTLNWLSDMTLSHIFQRLMQHLLNGCKDDLSLHLFMCSYFIRYFFKLFHKVTFTGVKYTEDLAFPDVTFNIQI